MSVMIEPNGAVNVEMDGLLIVSNTRRESTWVTCMLVILDDSILYVTGYNRCDLNVEYTLVPGQIVVRILNLCTVCDDLYHLYEGQHGWNPIPMSLAHCISRIMVSQLY